MNLTEFLSQLESALHMLPENERRDAVNYYAELIEDKAADLGYTVEETIAGLGSMDEIVSGIMEARTEQSSKAAHSETPPKDKQQSAHGLRTVHVKAEAVRQIFIRARNCPIEIQRGGNEEIELRYMQDEYIRYDLTVDNGELRLVQQPLPLISLFGIRQIFGEKSSVTLTVPAELAAALDAQTSNSHIQMEGISVWGTLRLATSNGRLLVSALSAKAMNLSSSNGRLQAENLSAPGPITLSTSNARLEAHQVASGDALTLRTSNGKIIFSNLEGTALTLRTSNAAVDGSLPHTEEEYSVTSGTSNGKNSLKHHAHQGPIPLDVRTSNSNIRVSFQNNP